MGSENQVKPGKTHKNKRKNQPWLKNLATNNMKIVILALFLAGSINALVRQDGKFQILNNASECLTLQTSTTTYQATDPVTQVLGFYPTAHFLACDTANEAQWFELNADSKLEADSLCLTPLPIDASSHVNLLSCDTWDTYSGVGTYLFSLACNAADNSQ